MLTKKYKLTMVVTAVCATALMSAATESNGADTAVINGIIYQLGDVPAVTITGHSWPAGEAVDRVEPLAAVNLSSFRGADSGVNDPVIPVRFISDKAFEGCVINELVLPLSLEEISADAFRNARINHIDFPRRLSIVREGAFAGVQGPEWLDFKEGLRCVSAQAFAAMPDVRQVTIPQYIHPTAESFAGLYNLEALRIYSETKPGEPGSVFWAYNTEPGFRKDWTLYVAKGTSEQYTIWSSGLKSGWVAYEVVEMEDTPMADAIKEVMGDRLRVRLQGRTLIMEPASEDVPQVAVYDIRGIRVASLRLDGEKSLTLPQGIYVVTCDGEARKVAVR